MATRVKSAGGAAVRYSRANKLEGWLKDLIRTFQSPDTRPDLTFGNLEDLSDPTQIHGLVIPQRGFRRVAVLITHLPGRPNGEVQMFALKDIEELAQFSETADATFGTQDMKHQYADMMAERFADPIRPPGQVLCISLAQVQRASGQALPNEGIMPGSRSMLQYDPPGAVWMLTVRKQPQGVAKFLETIATTPPPKASKHKKAETSPSLPNPPPKTPAIGAYNEPLLWFGKPPFPSAADLILDRAKRRLFVKEDRVMGGAIGGVDAHVYNTGRVVLVTQDRHLARNLINQFFAAMSRSGVPSLSLPDADLIEITDFEQSSGEVRGSTMSITPRNRLARPPDESSLMDYSVVVDTSVATKALSVADACASDPVLSELSLRYFDAVSLATREYYTDAFVVGWSIIESHLQSLFVQILTAAGISKSRIQSTARDWTASQRIDLSLLESRLSRRDAQVLHSLRKTRNDIVHNLASAKKEDAEACLTKANELINLPSIGHVPFKQARL